MSLRKELKSRLISLLAGISVENGCENTVAGVTRSFRSIDQISAFPHLAVLDGEQVLRAVSEEETLFEAEGSFAIVGCVKQASAADGSLSDACDSLIDDIKETILSNAQSLLSIVDAGSIRLVSDEILPDEIGGAGYIIVTVAIAYMHGTDIH